MNHPVEDISSVIQKLCQGTPAEQKATLNKYYLPDASFSHPFCRVPPMSNVLLPCYGEVNSRSVLLAIYRWYRILSPKIDFHIDSRAFDPDSNTLFVDMRQTFAIWFIPFYRADVHLTTKLSLTKRVAEAIEDKAAQDYLLNSDVGVPNGVLHYHIKRQEDLYQLNEFLKFVLLGIGPIICLVWQTISTGVCVLGTLVYFCFFFVVHLGQKAW